MEPPHSLVAEMEPWGGKSMDSMDVIDDRGGVMTLLMWGLWES